jgi:hypothetical protein
MFGLASLMWLSKPFRIKSYTLLDGNYNRIPYKCDKTSGFRHCLSFGPDGRGGHIVVNLKGRASRPINGRGSDAEGLEQPRDRPFNAWRIPKAEKAKAIVQDIIGQVQVYEQYYGLRKRRRKSTDQQAFEATVSALICDIAHHYLTEREGGVFVTRSNQVLGQRSRYRSVAYGKCLPTIIDRLATPEMAFVKQEVGSRNPFTGDNRTVIHVTAVAVSFRGLKTKALTYMT